MSAGGSGAPAEGGVNSNYLLVLGIIGGLIGIYLTPILGATVGPLFGCLGAVCAIVWGADAIRRVASYGLGTGVPSIGYMSLGIATVGSLAGLGIVAILPTLAGLGILAPILGLIFTMIIAVVVAVLAIKLIGMKIPIMVRCTAEIGGAAALSVITFAAAIAGTLDLFTILTTVFSTGFIAVLLIMNTMAVQHPFNACLGPNEDQARTLALAKATGFLAMVIVGILSLITFDLISCLLIVIVGLLLWYVSFRKFVKLSYGAAASVRWTGLWPKVEE